MNIGLGGDQHAGKTTLAGAFAKVEPDIFHIETWHPIGEVADKFHEQMPIPPEQNNIAWMNKWLTVLPAIVRDVLHADCQYEQISFTQKDVIEHPADYEKFFLHSVNLVKNPELAQHKITEDNKALYRPILQFLGARLVDRVSNTIWYDEIYNQIHQAKSAGAEHATVGGVRYKSDYETMRRHGDLVLKVVRPDMPAKDTNDPTERERNSWTPDITVFNTGEVEDLIDIAPEIWQDMKNRSYKPVYITKP